MIFYVEMKHTAKTEERIHPDCLYVSLRDGTEINADWDESEWEYEDGLTRGRAKGVYFDDSYANGRLSDVKEKISHISADTDGAVTRLLISDGDQSWEWTP